MFDVVIYDLYGNSLVIDTVPSLPVAFLLLIAYYCDNCEDKEMWNDVIEVRIQVNEATL